MLFEPFDSLLSPFSPNSSPLQRSTVSSALSFEPARRRLSMLGSIRKALETRKMSTHSKVFRRGSAGVASSGKAASVPSQPSWCSVAGHAEHTTHTRTHTNKDALLSRPLCVALSLLVNWPDTSDPAVTVSSTPPPPPPPHNPIYANAKCNPFSPFPPPPMQKRARESRVHGLNTSKSAPRINWVI